MAEKDCNTCGKSEPYNIKRDGIVGGKRRSKSLSTYGDPIADELKNLPAVSLMYRGFPVIPFLDEGDATLHFLRKMRELSPTQGSCHNNIKDYVMGGQFYVTSKKKPGFAHPDVVDVPASVSDHDYMVDFIENLSADFTTQKFFQIGEAIYDEYRGAGHGWLKVEFITVGSTKQVNFEVIDAEKGRYINPHKMQFGLGVDTVLISSSRFTSGTEEQLELIAEYPNTTDYGGGRSATVIPFSRKVSGRDWYGLPEHIQCLYYQFLDVQCGEYITEGYANGWTGKVFFETVMDDEDETDDDAFVDEVEYLFTNKGEGRRFLVRNRLVSDEETKVHEFADDTTHESHTAYSSVAERQIIKSNNWSSILMNIPQPGKLGQSQEFKDIFKIKYFTVIRPLQNKVCDVLNTGLELAADFLGDKRAAGFGVMLNNLFADLLKVEKEEGQTKTAPKTDENDAD